MIGVAVLTVLAVGCGAPPEVRDSGGLPTLPPSRATNSPTNSATPSFGALPGAVPTTAAADPGLVAVACPGEPSGKQIIELVRGGRGLLPGSARVSVRSGPLCAADWHLTTLDVAGYEPLQVVSRDRAGSLRLVTAGTDVCTAEVRVASPAGIQTLACGSDGGGPSGPSPTPGA
ncbi:hypothetical protein ACIBQ2_22225 [Micromonospora sediminimaris]|uniref:hypothetical protein n=1 Tax=Micromonospora sediminimaris TaxID=547162 RepID=UPI003799EA14